MKMVREILLICVLLVSGAYSQAGDFWDCNRMNQDCTGTGYTGCDTATGDCTCDAGPPAYSLVNQAFCVHTTTACDDAATCNSQGSCYTIGGTDTCYCLPEFTGTNCETPRLEVVCDVAGITVNIIPPTGFAGAIYAEGMSGTAACELTDTAGTYSVTLAYDNSASCGIVGPTAYTDGAETGDEYVIDFNIQHSTNNILLASDQTVKATCRISDTTTYSGTIASVNAQGLLDPSTGTANYAPVQFEIQKASDNTVVLPAATITVQDNLNLVFELEVNPSYDAFLVQTCKASNLAADPTDGTYDEIEFVTSIGCPANVPIVNGDHIAVTGPPVKVTVPIKAFVFLKGATSNANTLFFTCDVLLCATGDTACNAPTCTANTAFTGGLGRRRRDVAEGVTDGLATRTVQGTVTVRAGNYSITETLSEGTLSANTGVCLKNPEIQTALAVMGLAIFGLLIGLAIAVFAACRRRQDKKNPDTYSTSSTSGFDMHIPRPRV